MAEYGEWTRKGATLSDVTARVEYGITEDFIIQGIRQGRMEYRDGAIRGNPYLRLLKSQMESDIAAELGEAYLTKVLNQAELRQVKKGIAVLTKQLKLLQGRKSELEATLGQ